MPKTQPQSSAFAAMMKNKKACYPEEGVNLVGLDDYEAPGEQLYVIDHFDTKDEAEAAQKARKRKHPSEVTFLYGPNGEP